MTIDSFPPDVRVALKYYVYRLIDPRNGETFYVGKGKGDRIFAHAKGTLNTSEQRESAAPPKMERILEIKARGMEVAHIVHRHGMSEAAAKEVEAALIDAYPGLTNRIAGTGSDRGTMHVDELVPTYSAEAFVLEEPAILISIGRLWRRWDVYDAVRGLWRINLKRANRHGNLVLARVGDWVLGAYRPHKWMHGSPASFPLHDWSIDRAKYEKRVCFVGARAEDVWDKYVGKRVPAEYLPKKGAQTPFRYIRPRKTTNADQHGGNEEKSDIRPDQR